MNLDWMKLLESMLLVVVNFGSGAIPAFLLTWLIDRVLKVAPWLSPYRELVKQYVLGKIEQIKLERTQGVVMAAEQIYLQNTKDAKDKDAARDVRARTVLEAMSDRRITQTVSDAKLLVEGAVGQLKSVGVL